MDSQSSYSVSCCEALSAFRCPHLQDAVLQAEVGFSLNLVQVESLDED